MWFLGEPQLAATVTYENTTEDFAAAVVTADPQGLRIYYCLLVPGRRTIGIVPWKLEAGDTYRVVYDIDAGDDGKIDIITEQHDLVFPQRRVVDQTTSCKSINSSVAISSALHRPPACRPRIFAIIRAGICPRHESTMSVPNLFEASKSPSMAASRPRAGNLSLCSRSQTSKIPMIWRHAW